MTHSSGIGVSQELANKFGTSLTQSGTRFIKACIQNDSVALVDAHPDSANFEADFRSIQTYLEPGKACYILVKMDAPSSTGAHWKLLAYVPDNAPVKERMLYASTRDLLKKQLGSNNFSDDMHGTTKDEFSWETFQASKSAKTTPAPLSSSESLAQKASALAIDPGHTREYVHSVKFPLSREAFDKIAALNGASSPINFVQLYVDPSKETIELGSAESVTVDSLHTKIPSHEPRFSLFKYEHEWEGASVSPIVFVYSCTNHSPVKLKMLYSTVKAPAIEGAEQAGLPKLTRIEVQEPEELTQDLLDETLHPKAEEKAKRITRPTRPGKGAARLVRK